MNAEWKQELDAAVSVISRTLQVVKRIEPIIPAELFQEFIDFETEMMDSLSKIETMTDEESISFMVWLAVKGGEFRTKMTDFISTGAAEYRANVEKLNNPKPKDDGVPRWLN